MRLSPLSRRFLRQSHFSATVWTGFNYVDQSQRANHYITPPPPVSNVMYHSDSLQIINGCHNVTESTCCRAEDVSLLGATCWLYRRRCRE